ncbi:hypothetical protein KC19_4G152000 [Ceratodon purpureus]|uniref:Uncharacterized protein n=1 Tax=Ceratodon purpureus TaxID=3225 RepID=A0A8T0IB39_CERPU|nr:hypothetical protein KC19_4G152000 [Ceratodon purpureus]
MQIQSPQQGIHKHKNINQQPPQLQSTEKQLSMKQGYHEEKQMNIKIHALNTTITYTSLQLKPHPTALPVNTQATKDLFPGRVKTRDDRTQSATPAENLKENWNPTWHAKVPVAVWGSKAATL